MSLVRATHMRLPSVVTFGNFDGVHLGHRHLFSNLQNLEGQNVLQRVAITFEPHPAILLHSSTNFLICDWVKKIQLLSSLLDAVVVYDFLKIKNLSPRCFLELICSDINVRYIVVGSDARFGSGKSGNVELLASLQEEYQYKLVTVDQLSLLGSPCSSTLIREAITAGRIQDANNLLGRPYSISERVQPCRGLGQTIGFPTINLILSDALLIPKIGVYKGKVRIDGITYSGLINVGRRPTVEDAGRIIVEMHIFDFDRMIYGKCVEIFFISFIRAEMKFSSVDELKLQIAQDVKNARQK